MDIVVREIAETDRAWVRELLEERWGSTRIVSRGTLHDADTLPGFIAMAGTDPVGLVTFQPGDNTCELVTLDAVIENHGVGSALIAAIRQYAMAAGWKQLSVVTTNDNTRALRFYQKRGFVIAAIHVDAVTEARKLKPSIPLLGADGIPLRDEIELHLMLA